MFTIMLTLSCIILKNSQTYFKNFPTARFLKYVCQFFKIMHERVHSNTELTTKNAISLKTLINISEFISK